LRRTRCNTVPIEKGTETGGRIHDLESNKEIAVHLAISEGTVRVHASNVFAKLGCSDRAQAVAVAFHRGIICIE
jgi:FixJ family two-component response regulator